MISENEIALLDGARPVAPADLLHLPLRKIKPCYVFPTRSRVFRSLLYPFGANCTKTQKRPADIRAATGSVKTHAAAMLRMVDHCRPLLFAIMVPATPEESTWVVLTGMP